MIKEKISALASAIMCLLSYLLGGFDSVIAVFCTIVIIDTFTGMLKGWNAGLYESKKFRRGFTLKCGYFLGLMMTVQIDILIGSKGVLRDTVLTFFIANESFSIVENLGAMGVKFPVAITKAIKSLNKEENDQSE